MFFYHRGVVVEDITHLKSLLEVHRNDSSPEKLLEILEKLKFINPSKDILKYTKIGHTVNSLRRCDNMSVRELSKLIGKNWKKLVGEETAVKECIDVRCDAKSEFLRSKARKLLANCLDINVSIKYVSNKIHGKFSVENLLLYLGYSCLSEKSLPKA